MKELKCSHCGSILAPRNTSNPVWLRCKHCQQVWKYRGKSTEYATCPHCLYKVRIDTSTLDATEAENMKPRKVTKEEIEDQFDLEPGDNPVWKKP